MSRLKVHSYDEKQVSFFNIDQHAYQATLNDANDFPTLISYLKRQIPAHAGNQTLYLARSIIAWLSYAQNQFAVGKIGKDRREPVKLVQKMANQEVFHSEVFQKFCGEASIECLIIQGRCKAIQYKAGDQDSDYLRRAKSWNAFKAEGQWHLVNPAWVLHAVINHTRGGEIELIGPETNIFLPLPHCEGIHHHVFNDFWFCTDPEIFVTRCLPNYDAWQLLPSDKTINSVQEFLSIPDLRQGFFRTKLELLTEKHCRLTTKHGRCLIAFCTDRETARRLQFSYQLSLIAGQVPPNINVEDLQQCIFHSRPSDNIFNFEIRFLFIGTFRLIIKSGYIHEKFHPTCSEFLIECPEIDPKCNKLPIHAGEVGWGPGTVSDDAGIKGSSEKTGKVLLEPSIHDPSKKTKTITLKPREDALNDTIFESELCGHEMVDDGEVQIEFPVSRSGVVRVDKEKCKLELDVEVIGDRDSAVVVTARNINTPNREASRILNYLLLTEEDENDIEERVGLKQKERKARKQFKTKEKSELRDSLLKEFTMMKDQVDGYVGGRRVNNQLVGQRDTQNANKLPGQKSENSKACTVS